MTPRELANKKRCIAAMDRHLKGSGRVDQTKGEWLYGFLDAALGKLKPSQADAGRSNAIRWLRRRAAR